MTTHTIYGPESTGYGSGASTTQAGMFGESYVIGDGLWLTAGHVIYEWDRRSGSAPNIVTDSEYVGKVNDYRSYASAYATEVTSVAAGASTIDNETIEGKASVNPHDSVVLTGQSGTVGPSDSGLVTFVSYSDLGSVNTSVNDPSATVTRYAQTTRTGTVTSVQSSGQFQFSVISQKGDSGGAYVLNTNGHSYVIGTHDGNSTTAGDAVGTYLTYSEWSTLTALAVAGQPGDLTLSEPQNLLVGSSNADTVTGTARPDLLLGRGGTDSINDGDSATSAAWANDTLVGGDGNDTLSASKGNDILWGGEQGSDAQSDGQTDTADYSAGAQPITINYDGTTPVPGLTVLDGTGGTDTLHSIETIKATGGPDVFTFKGVINPGYHLTVDFDGGQPAGRASVVNAKGSTDLNGMAVSVDHETAVLSNPGHSGSITFTDFGHNVIASDFGDTVTISLVDSGTSALSQTSLVDQTGSTVLGGEGNDTITAVDGDNDLYGGNGDDIITGGSGRDIIAGGRGSDNLDGGDGDDLIIDVTDTGASAGPDMLFGGDGNDHLVVVSPYGSGAVLDGGAGNDMYYNEGYEGADPVGSVVLAPGSGHDEVVTNAVVADIGIAGADNDDDSFHNVSCHVAPFYVSANLNLSDLKMVWDAHVEDYNANMSAYELRGDLAIVIKATGDSVLMRDVVGYQRTDNPLGPSSLIGILGIGLWFEDGILRVDHEFGSVAAYDVAAGAYSGRGLEQDQSISGSSSSDTLAGGSGNDTISGGDGEDLLDSSMGTDRFDGGAGLDEYRVLASLGDFSRSQSAGNLVLTSLDGTEGDVTLSSVERIYSVTDTAFYDVQKLLLQFGTSGIDTIEGTPFSDTITGLAGNDVISASAGVDTIDGGTGTDQVIFTGLASDYFVTRGSDGSLIISNVADPMSTSSLINVETLHFVGGGSDIATSTLLPGGTSGNDTLVGSVMGDTLSGLDGNDTISGLAGNDTLYGNAGADTLLPGLGNDVVDGGDGIDIVSYADVTAAVTVDLSLTTAQNTIGAGIDQFTGIENVVGSAFADTLNGDANANMINGGDGADLIKGNDGNDNLYGNMGNDTIYGNVGTDYLNGGQNDDYLSGGMGTDTLIGGVGNDTLIGGAAADTLTGSDGSDIFKYLFASDSTPTAFDTITDFVSGTDKIDLSAIHTASADTFTITQSGGNTLVSVDLAGNGSIDLRIQVTGVNKVVANDIQWTAAQGGSAAYAQSAATDDAFAGPHHLVSSSHTNIWYEHSLFA